MRYLVIILFILVLPEVIPVPYSLAGTAKGQAPGLSKENIDRMNNTAHAIFLGSPYSAREIAARALLLSEKLNYSTGKSRSLYNIGMVYWSQSYYAISLFYLRSALANTPRKEHLYISDTYRAIGRTYTDLKDPVLAMAYLDSALLYAGTDFGQRAEVFSERAYVYSLTGEYKLAVTAAQRALFLNKKVNARGNIAVGYGRLGGIYRQMGLYKNALAYTDTALLMSEVNQNKRLSAYNYIEYALIYNSTGKYDDAVQYAEKGITIASSIGNLDATSRGYTALANAFELKHQLRTALDVQKRYNKVRDSLSTIAKLKTINLVQNYYELNSKLAGIALMDVKNNLNKAKIKSQHTLIKILLLTLVVLVMILFATYYFYNQKKFLSNRLQRQHNILLEQKQVIEAQTANLQNVNSLKDKLLAVIGHDLRTPVANLSNIIEMFEDGYLSAKDVNSLMKEINPIIKGAELTLSNLVEWAGSQIKGITLQQSNVDIFLLGVEMEQTFLHALLQKKLEFVNHAYPGQGVFADENHLKVILRNLISNAIKFTGKNGTITLSTIIENGALVISVTDNGKGMTAEEIDKLFYLNTHFSHSGTLGEKGTGIGLLLCKELVELNGGSLLVKSHPGEGTTFYFNLPLIKAYA